MKETVSQGEVNYFTVLPSSEINFVEINDNSLAEENEEDEDIEELQEEYLFHLPPNLTINQLKCLSVWRNTQHIAFGIF